MSDNSFFEESLEQSRIKAAIVSKYFDVWSNIILSTARKHGTNTKMAYVDLFAGPGFYIDGTKSTPLIVLEHAIQNDDLAGRLVTIFNDKNRDNAASLSRAISEIPRIDELQYPPQILSAEIGEEITDIFERLRLIPTLLFIDPWGYKGLSLRLIKSVLKNWGCDCIFFFNYNRINPGLDNLLVREHIDALFGEERAQKLRQRIESMSPQERELTIVDEIAQALNDIGGKFVLPFRFINAKRRRTSHHLIFVTKHFRGYERMKAIMAPYSSSNEQGVPSFEYNVATVQQPLLFGFQPKPLEELKVSLLEAFKGQQLSFRQVYERHSIGTPFLEKNYRQALSELEAERRVLAISPKEKRRPGTFAEHVQIKFP